MNRSLQVSTNELTFNALPSNGGQVVVTVDGITDNNTFRIEQEGDWFIVNRDRCVLEVIPSDNPSEEEREGYITVRHNCNSKYVEEIHVVQSGQEYSITPDKLEEQLHCFLKDECFTEMFSIPCTVKGGREMFYVKNISQFQEINGGDDIPVEFDNCFKCLVDSTTNTLKIINYGRVYMKDKENTPNYFLITLAHIDKRYVTTNIKVTYNNLDDPVGKC